MLTSTLRRLGLLPALRVDADTAGDDDDDPSEWDGGRLTWARWAPAHPGRVGRAIRPWAVVLHTTDMHPSTFGALVRAWSSKPGAGNGAHFILGRTPAEGLVQLVDVGRNSNHAGGKPAHGWFRTMDGRVHPNAVSVGIEVHNAGEVRLVAGQWRTGTYGNGWTPHGAPLDPADVVVDERRRDRGLHRPTAWQLTELRRLLEAFASCPAMTAAPAIWATEATGPVQPWAPLRHVGPHALVGHHTLDPARKGDPHRLISEWLRDLP